jgi:hypothetical protein
MITRDKKANAVELTWPARLAIFEASLVDETGASRLEDA